MLISTIADDISSYHRFNVPSVGGGAEAPKLPSYISLLLCSLFICQHASPTTFPRHLSLSLWEAISSHGCPAAILCHHLWQSGLASWSAQSHPPKLASSQVWGLFLCVCACSDVAVYSLAQYNIHDCMLQLWGTINDCTNRRNKNRSLWIFGSHLPSFNVSCTRKKHKK